MGRYDALYQSSPPPATTVLGTPTRPAATRAKSEPVQRVSLSEIPPVRATRSDGANDRTDAARASLLDEITTGAPNHRRPTERYSFEIFTDQKPRIEELQYRFRQRTGKKLSSSRIIREAIEAYLPEAFRALADQPNVSERTEPTER